VRRDKINKKRVEAVEDHEIELFKQKHGLKTDLEAYEFLKKRLSQRLGVIP